MIDILDDQNAYDYLLTEEILKESMMMIEANIFRTFANKSKLPDFKYNFFFQTTKSNNKSILMRTSLILRKLGLTCN